MLEGSLAKSLLQGWELAAYRPIDDALVGAMHSLLGQNWPFPSAIVYQFDAASKGLLVVGASGPNGSLVSRQPSQCTDSKWIELEKWVTSGEILRQNSPRRSGKLALLAPDAFSESMAIPLHVEGASESLALRGAVVFEIERGRIAQPKQDAQLLAWGGPFGLGLANRVRGNREATRDLGSQDPSDRADRKALREIVVGADAGLRAVMERVQLVAGSDMPVLILGDTGTGKEVVARAIHTRSARSSGPFLRVNCGAIPPELIDSQLFGHERGSFTGASDQRKGWFERAEGGTLFLDEIGELPLAAQVRLLRVLQEKQIERVGGQETLHVDVRIVTATHRDLASMVHQRTFREDLWYRINVFPILLPRLSERREDIPELARHFARKASTSFGIPYVEPTYSDIDQLIEYHWPGNIRELQAVIDRAVILGRGVRLEIATSLGIGQQPRYAPLPDNNEPTFYEVIPESIPPVGSISTGSSPPVPTVGSSNDSRIESLNESMKRHIERALIACNGQIEGKRGAAETLRINPHTLRAKMRKLGIHWSDYRKS
jgi:hydrogenase-4 transcriptional activator